MKVEDLKELIRPFAVSALPDEVVNFALYSSVNLRGYHFRGGCIRELSKLPAGTVFTVPEYGNCVYVRDRAFTLRGVHYVRVSSYVDSYPLPADTLVCVWFSNYEE